MSSFSKSAIFTFLTQIPTQLFGIIAGIFITRVLGAEGRGLYAIFYADISLFTTILGFSINTAIIQYTASKRISFEKLLGLSVLFSFATIILSMLILLIWLNLPISELLFPKNYTSWHYIIWFILFLTISQINTLYSSFLQGARKFNVVNRVSLVNSIFNLLLFGIAYILHVYNIHKIYIFEILIIGLIVIILNTLQWHYHYKKVFHYKFSLKLKWKKDIKEFFNFSGLGHLSNIVNFFNYRLVLWIIAYYMDNAQVGIFSLAAGLAQLLNFVSTPLSQVLMPFLSAENAENRKILFMRFSRIHFSTLLLLSFFSITLAPIFIPILYGEEFNEAVIAFEIMIFGIILSCQTRIFASYFIAENMVHINLYATLIGFGLTFFFNFILIQYYGINGASFAQTITYFGIFMFVFIALIKFAKIKTYNLFIINLEDINYARSKFKRKSR